MGITKGDRQPMTDERNTKELRLRKLAELEKQYSGAWKIIYNKYEIPEYMWPIFYSRHSETKEYRQIVRLTHRILALQKEVDNL